MSQTIIESIEEFGLSAKNRPKQLFSKVGIVGCGTIGQNIALMISQKDIEVIFIELTDENIQHAIEEISIGAFPLLPCGDITNNSAAGHAWLRSFLAKN